MLSTVFAKQPSGRRRKTALVPSNFYFSQGRVVRIERGPVGREFAHARRDYIVSRGCDAGSCAAPSSSDRSALDLV